LLLRDSLDLDWIWGAKSVTWQMEFTLCVCPAWTAAHTCGSCWEIRKLQIYLHKSQ